MEGNEDDPLEASGEFSQCFLPSARICRDDDLEVCSGLVHPSDPEWRAKVSENVLVQNDQDPEIQEEIEAKALCVDDEEEKAPEMKSTAEALKIA